MPTSFGRPRGVTSSPDSALFHRRPGQGQPQWLHLSAQPEGADVSAQGHRRPRHTSSPESSTPRKATSRDKWMPETSTTRVSITKGPGYLRLFHYEKAEYVPRKRPGIHGGTRHARQAPHSVSRNLNSLRAVGRYPESRTQSVPPDLRRRVPGNGQPRRRGRKNPGFRREITSAHPDRDSPPVLRGRCHSKPSPVGP